MITVDAPEDCELVDEPVDPVEPEGRAVAGTRGGPGRRSARRMRGADLAQCRQQRRDRVVEGLLVDGQGVLVVLDLLLRALHSGDRVLAGLQVLRRAERSRRRAARRGRRGWYRGSCGAGHDRLAGRVLGDDRLVGSRDVAVHVDPLLVGEDGLLGLLHRCDQRGERAAGSATATRRRRR